MNVSFPVETSKVGYDDLDTYIFYNGKTQQVKQEQLYRGQFDITFVPQDAGQYMVSVYCGGVEIPGLCLDFIINRTNSSMYSSMVPKNLNYGFFSDLPSTPPHENETIKTLKCVVSAC